MTGRPEQLSRVHPVADLFPMMSDAEYAELLESMREHGQQVSILSSADGYTILDGRNRLRACRELGIPPRVVAIRAGTREEVIIDAITDRNLIRRELTATQKGLLALEILPFHQAAAKVRQRAAGGDKRSVTAPVQQPPGPRAPTSAQRVADKIGVSARTVAHVKKVVAAAPPEIVADMRAGRTTVAAAARALAAPPKADPTREFTRLHKAALNHLDGLLEAVAAIRSFDLPADEEKRRADFIEIATLKLAMVDLSS